MVIKTSIAFLVYAFLMFGGMVLSGYKMTIPYETFAINFTLGFGVYVTKRLIQKGKWFGNGEGVSK